MLLALAIILIILISTMIVVIITSLDSFNEDIIRIDEAVSNIENVLNKRFDLLSKSIDVIKKHLNKDNITIKTIDEIKEKKLDNYTLDKKLYGAIKEFHVYGLDNFELKKADEYTKIEIDLIETEAEIMALKQYYNDLVDNYNKKIDKFPTSMVAKAKNYEPMKKFEMIDNTKVINKLK